MLFEMNNPNPVPPVSDLVANFVNNLGNIPGSIPSPLSFILTTAWSSLFSTDIDIVPSSVNLRALLSRLSIT
jgi:hypothetical protein